MVQDNRKKDFSDGSFLVADGAYSGEKNSRLASEHNLKLVTTNFTGRKPDEIYADFLFTEDGKYLIKCKNDCNPEECSYVPGNDRSVAYFQRSNIKSFFKNQWPNNHIDRSIRSGQFNGCCKYQKPLIA